jgi:hypothetical protein
MSPSFSPVVVLKLPRTAKGVLFVAKSILTAMRGNPYLPAPAVPLDTVEAHVDALAMADAFCLTRMKGARESRDVVLLDLCGDLESLRVYVQGVASRTAPAEAAAIVEGAGMSLRRIGARSKGELEAKDGRVSGSVHLVAKSVAKTASYEWQYSTDPARWIDLPPTLQAHTVVSGLTPATRYSFRCRALVRGGRRDFSQVVSVLAK